MDEANRLKIYLGSKDQFDVDSKSDRSPDHQITVKFRSVVDSLVDAIQSDRTWLNDFRDDDIVISKDLHEVLVAYENLRRSA